MRLHWSRRATADVDRHWDFLAERDPDYADRVEARINDRAQALIRFPYLGHPDKRSGALLLSIPDIQYVISYVIEDDVIRIAHVWSTRENREWR